MNWMKRKFWPMHFVFEQETNVEQIILKQLSNKY